MRLSKFFMPILRDNPKEAEILSHRLMLRAGMIRQEAAGIYAWLPLGFRVLQKIERIVREEMDRAGAVEMLMPTLQLADLWRESGRYDAYGPEMLRITDRNKRELLYGPTNEEMITEIFRDQREELPRAAEEPLSLPVEVPRRAAPALRRDARPRVLYEGRLFLRRRRGGRAPLLQQDVRLPTSASSREWASSASRCAPRPGRSAATSATSSSCWPRPANPASTSTETSSTCRSRPRASTTTATSARDRRAMDDALRGDRGRARFARFEAETPQDKRVQHARHRGRPGLLFRRQVHEAMKALVAGPDGTERAPHCGSYGVGRLAPRRCDH